MPSQFCPHGRRRRRCKDCGGSGICEHGRQRSACKDCGGGSICEHGRQRSHCKDCKVTVTTGRKPKTTPAKKTKKPFSTEDAKSKDGGSYDSDEEEDYELESESESEGDVSTAELNIDGDDEVEDHQDVFPTLIYYKGRSKRGREPGEPDEAGGQSQRRRYIPGM